MAKMREQMKGSKQELMEMSGKQSQMLQEQEFRLQ